MTNTYLLDVIKAMQPTEQHEVRLLMETGFLNNRKVLKEVVQLYKLILATAPEFSDDALSKEIVYEKLFGQEAFVVGKLEKLMAELNKLLRNFLINQRFMREENEVQQQLEWAAWLREKGLSIRAKQVLSKLQQTESKEMLESLDYYKTQLLIAEEEHSWQVKFNTVKGDLNIPQLIHLLDLYYHNYRVERINRYLNQQKGAQLPKVDFATPIVQELQNENILLLISNVIFNQLSNEFPDVEETLTLRRLLLENESKLSHQTLDHFYGYLRNFCTLHINCGDLEFIPILHGISKQNLEKGYYLLDGKITPSSYINLVQVALRAGDIDWAKSFTQNYKNLIIGGDEDKQFYRFNMAFCLFASRQYEDALTTMPEMLSNTHYYFRIRRLELQIYYETNSDLLLYKIDSYRKFIERTAPKSISADLLTMHLNFLKILQQLAQSPPKDKARAQKILSRIESKKLIADRLWLMEKARQVGGI